MKKILLLAGEESGVLYSKRIAAELADRGQVEIRGYGDYGFKTADLAVFGIWAVVRKIFYFLRVKRTLERAIDEWRPDVVCTIDYPGLNLKLAAYAHERGIRAVHVVCPQVWAWHTGRIPKIERSLDAICCFLPFEPMIFRKGLATFVGHPLVEEFGDVSAADRESPRNVLAVLPGSRLGEIGYHMPVVLEAISLLQTEGICPKIIIPAANDRAHRELERILRRATPEISAAVTLTHGGAREALKLADAAIVSSGTATLEAALLGCPTVLVYKVGYLLGEFLRRAIKGTRYVGLANVIWDRCGGTGEQPTPELLQERFTAANVVAELRGYLTDARCRVRASSHLIETCSLLRGDGDSMSRIADIVLSTERNS